MEEVEEAEEVDVSTNLTLSGVTDDTNCKFPSFVLPGSTISSLDVLDTGIGT